MADPRAGDKLAEDDPLANWNPMEEAFLNPVTNAYDNLQLDQQPAYKALVKKQVKVPTIEESRTYQLFISNIPMGLNTRGLENLFRQFGEVLEARIFKRPGSTTTDKGMGNVTFQTHMEAQKAIDALDRQGPHNLRVQFSIPKEERERRKQEEQKLSLEHLKISEKMEEFHKSKGLTGPNRAAGVGLQLQETAAKHRFPQPPFLEDDFSYQPDDSDLTDDDQEVIANSEPPLETEVEEPPINVENLRPFTIGYRKILRNQPPADCTKCGSTAKACCSRCRTWYCSQRCQIADWEDHKGVCVEVEDEPTMKDKYRAILERHRNTKSPTPQVPKEQEQPEPKQEMGCSKSILEQFEEGTTITMCVASSTLQHLAGMCIDLEDNHLDYLVSDLTDEAKTKNEEEKISNAAVGSYVICEEQEGVWFRGKVVDDQAKGISVEGIDQGQVLNVSSAIPITSFSPLAAELPSCSLECQITRKLIPEEEEILDAVVQEGFVKIKITKKRQNWSEGVILNSKSLGSLRLRILGCDSSRHWTMDDLTQSDIPVGSKVLRTDNTWKTNIMTIQRLNDVGSVKMIEKMLWTFSQKLIPLNRTPQKNEILICRHKKTDKLYRARIVAVNKEKRKVKTEFLDYGKRSVESFNMLFEFPISLADFPVKGIRLELKGVDSKELSSKNYQLRNLVTQLRPLLDMPLTLESLDNGIAVLRHPNGDTVNDMIARKTCEEFGEYGRGNVQGEMIGGGFEYDKCHVARLPESGRVSVTVLSANSPIEIYLVGNDQIGIAETLPQRIAAYCSIDHLGKGRGYTPRPGQICLAKTDGQYMRGIRITEDDDQDGKMQIFFVDLGYFRWILRSDIMQVHPLLMDVPMLANRCCLKGFEDPGKWKLYAETYSEKMKECLAPMTQLTVDVVGMVEGAYIVDVPELAQQFDATIETQSSLMERLAEERRLRLEKEAELEKLRKATG